MERSLHDRDGLDLDERFGLPPSRDPDARHRRVVLTGEFHPDLPDLPAVTVVVRDVEEVRVTLARPSGLPPAATFVTPSPMAETTPAASCPSRNG